MAFLYIPIYIYIHIYPDHCERYTKMGREKKVGGKRKRGGGKTSS